MTEYELRVLATFVNVTLITIMLVSGLWVALDTRKTRLTRAEKITWVLFATMFIVIGPLLYIYFRKKIYKN